MAPCLRASSAGVAAAARACDPQPTLPPSAPLTSKCLALPPSGLPPSYGAAGRGGGARRRRASTRSDTRSAPRRNSGRRRRRAPRRPAVRALGAVGVCPAGEKRRAGHLGDEKYEREATCCRDVVSPSLRLPSPVGARRAPHLFRVRRHRLPRAEQPCRGGGREVPVMVTAAATAAAGWAMTVRLPRLPPCYCCRDSGQPRRPSFGRMRPCRTQCCCRRCLAELFQFSCFPLPRTPLPPLTCPRRGGLATPRRRWQWQRPGATVVLGYPPVSPC